MIRHYNRTISEHLSGVVTGWQVLPNIRIEDIRAVGLESRIKRKRIIVILSPCLF